jgi:hypothetical protein
MRERGTWAEWRVGEGERDGGGRAGSSRLRLDINGGGGERGICGGRRGARWSASNIEVVSGIITKSRLVLILVLKPKVALAFISEGNHWSK